MNMPLKAWLSRPGALIVLGVLLFLSVTVLTDRYLRGLHADLTDDGLYTLSDGTAKVVSGFEEPVTLRYYFSRTLAAPYPQILSYGKRIEDLLRAFEALNPGQVHLSIIDPEPFSEAEDDAVATGLQGIPLGDGSTLYMGLAVTDSADGEAVVPFFTEEREAFLEYDLVKLLIGLDDSGRKKIALITQLPMQFGVSDPQMMTQGRAQPYVVYDQLQDFFDIEELDPDFTALPADTDLLMIVHPPALGDDQLFAIDQFVLKGGKALVFLDPHSEAMNPRATMPSASDLGPLLGAWGATMPAGKVVADASLAQRVQMGGYGPESVKDYILWLAVGRDFLSSDDPVSGSVTSLNFASAGALLPLEGATTAFQPIVTTSTVSELLDATRAVGMPDPDALLRDFAPTDQSYTLAARISGRARTAFEARVAASTGPVENPPMLEGDINVVLVSDSDLFDDRFWVQLQELLGQRIVVPIAGNGSFIVNLAENMAGSDALLALRGRGVSKRPFEVVNAIRRDAEARYLSEEQMLQDRLSQTQARLEDLEHAKPEDTMVVSPEQEAEIEEFRTQLLETRKALREVKRNLRQEIDSLGAWLAAINIVLMPFLVVVFALLRGYMRRRALADRL